VVSWTAKRQRDLWFTPDEIFPADKFVSDTAAWWKSMQPVCRKAESQGPFYFGERTNPTDISEWGEVRKAGSNGLFLMIMAISWIPQAIASLPPTSRPRAELLAVFEAMVYDVEWVLGAICGLEDGKAEGEARKKRKPEKIEGAVPLSDLAARLSKKPRKV
jgi:hypothetical protein